MFGQEGSAQIALQGCKKEVFRPVPGQDEADEAVAQAADAIVQDQGMG